MDEDGYSEEHVQGEKTLSLHDKKGKTPTEEEDNGSKHRFSDHSTNNDGL